MLKRKNKVVVDSLIEQPKLPKVTNRNYKKSRTNVSKTSKVKLVTCSQTQNYLEVKANSTWNKVTKKEHGATITWKLCQNYLK